MELLRLSLVMGPRINMFIPRSIVLARYFYPKTNEDERLQKAKIIFIHSPNTIMRRNIELKNLIYSNAKKSID